MEESGESALDSTNAMLSAHIVLLGDDSNNMMKYIPTRYEIEARNLQDSTNTSYLTILCHSLTSRPVLSHAIYTHPHLQSQTVKKQEIHLRLYGGISRDSIRQYLYKEASVIGLYFDVGSRKELEDLRYTVRFSISVLVWLFF